jgi:hypothetical protein
VCVRAEENGAGGVCHTYCPLIGGWRMEQRVFPLRSLGCLDAFCACIRASYIDSLVYISLPPRKSRATHLASGCYRAPFGLAVLAACDTCVGPEPSASCPLNCREADTQTVLAYITSSWCFIPPGPIASSSNHWRNFSPPATPGSQKCQCSDGRRDWFGCCRLRLFS